MLRLAALAAAATAVPNPLVRAGQAPHLTRLDEAFLDDLIRQGCLYFYEQASPQTGQVLDRSRNNLAGARDPRRMASIAATGFGLTALCIADHRGYLPHSQVVERVRTTLDWHLNHLPEVHGFFFHFSDVETGKRWRRAELSSIDTAILLCGIQTARAYFADARIQQLAQQLYERVDWPWMLNGGAAFAMGWFPESGFIPQRWSHYCELMMIYLLAIGSPTHPVSPDHWNAFSRPIVRYGNLTYHQRQRPHLHPPILPGLVRLPPEARPLRRLLRQLHPRHQSPQSLLPLHAQLVQPRLLGHFSLRFHGRLHRLGWPALARPD